MAHNESSSSDHHHPESPETSTNVRQRAMALQKKVSELSETFERIEQNLAAAKAGEKGDDSSD
jgi:phage shock protein A